MGAAVLASTAIKTGCGLVTAFVPCGYDILQIAIPSDGYY
jgi:hypothetical protein